MRITGQQVRDALIRALADEYSRKILLGTVERARSVEDLSEIFQIPISTAYRRVNEMREVGLLTVEKTILTDEGKKFELFRSSFKGINLQLDKGDIVVDVELNEDVATRLSRLWASLRAG
ncbi:MAG TPA: helix-turn-helix domain-containing protein [Nitrososphaerales archaeon]|nr:helix-turn-helix domain-containing protein [Nitrososphaerales archaeon]